MRLAELEPQFLKVIDNRTYWHEGVSFNEADGVVFLCPKCFRVNQGPIGTHSIICWRPHVSQEIPPNPGRWEFQGTGLDDLTLVAGSSSILLTGGCAWHGFIRNGEVTDA